MIKETMTIRKALTQKKLLDNQISELFSTRFIAVATSKRAIIDGMNTKNWLADAEARFQSLNDKMKRREAISKAIMEANAKHTVKVPKFIGIDKQTDETEELTFASAIARKNYLFNLYQHELQQMRRRVVANSDEYQKAEREADNKVSERLYQEFANITQASGKARQERETELREQYGVQLLDPNQLAEKLLSFTQYVEGYIAEIDSVLGHATEVTEITVEY